MKVRNSEIKLVVPLPPRRHTHSFLLMLCPGAGHLLDPNSGLWCGLWCVCCFHSCVQSAFQFYWFLPQQLSLWTALSIPDGRHLTQPSLTFSHRLPPHVWCRGLVGLRSHVHRSAQLHGNQLHQDACIIIVLPHSETLSRSLFPITSDFNSPPSLAFMALAPVLTIQFLAIP